MLLRGGGYVGALALSLIVVYFATRDKKATAPATHQHALGVAPTGGGPTSVSLSPDDARRIGVTYATATVGAFGKEVRTVGQLTIDEAKVKTIAPRVDGWVEKLFVNTIGQMVAEGEPVFSIYSPMLVAAQEELLLAKRLERDIATGSEEARRRAADLVASARRRLEYWNVSENEIAEIERTGQVRRTMTLHSMATGYVIEKSVLVGQKIMAGDALFKVADLSDVWIEGQVFEQDLAVVRVGQLVHADFQALPGEHRMGRIAYIYPTLDPETRTARVRVVLRNREGLLKPGMYATIRIEGTLRPNVLTIPRVAVLSTGERSIVFVREANGTLGPREVLLGSATAERVEILQGLSAGEQVVSSATFLVDAESNLGTALGGMGNMPGMDMTTPPKALPMRKE
jgi:Cu(I)/Ag(I) efflux system membrane fusion protein